MILLSRIMYIARALLGLQSLYDVELRKSIDHLLLSFWLDSLKMFLPKHFIFDLLDACDLPQSADSTAFMECAHLSCMMQTLHIISSWILTFLDVVRLCCLVNNA